MKLSKEIIRKYNTLFREAANYYNIKGQSLIVMPSTDLLYPYSFDWDISNSGTINDNMLALQKDYPYLVAFYKIFVSMYSRKFRNVYIDEDTFTEINKNMKQIRSRKLTGGTNARFNFPKTL